jgi:uncharacterized protein (DUF1330 family)
MCMKSAMKRALNKGVPTLVALFIGMIIGMGIGEPFADEVKPAYLVVSVNVTDSAALDPYRQAARPLSRAAGVEILARSEVELFEGEWPHFQVLTLEKFDSMKALKAFWNSAEYQKVKSLREGFIDVDFIVAVEGS